MTGDRGSVRLYRALLGLYPRSFRDDYGADMVQLLRDQCADEPAWRVCGRAVVDLALTIPTQRMETHMNRTSTHLVALLYSAVSAAGVLLAVVGGTNSTTRIAGPCIAIAAAAMAAIAWGRSGPIGAGISTAGWWKLLTAGPCIVVAVIIAAGIGVDAWFVGMFAIFLAFVLTGTGVLLGLLRLTNRYTPKRLT